VQEAWLSFIRFVIYRRNNTFFDGNINLSTLSSDGGANPPESCIFGQFLNMSALLSKLILGF
jgi:hypothetical protein